MDYETGKALERIEEVLTFYDERLKEIEKKVGLKLKEEKEEKKNA